MTSCLFRGAFTKSECCGARIFSGHHNTVLSFIEPIAVGHGDESKAKSGGAAYPAIAGHR
jgi:hypothetical protein